MASWSFFFAGCVCIRLLHQEQSCFTESNRRQVVGMQVERVWLASLFVPSVGVGNLNSTPRVPLPHPRLLLPFILSVPF